MLMAGSATSVTKFCQETCFQDQGRENVEIADLDEHSPMVLKTKDSGCWTPREQELEEMTCHSLFSSLTLSFLRNVQCLGFLLNLAPGFRETNPQVLIG